MGKKLKKADLIKAAKDICDVCGLEDSKGGPAIKTGKSVKLAKIEEGIKEAAEFMEEDDMDDLKPGTVKILEGLDCMPTFDEEADEDEDTDEVDDAEDSEDEDEDEESDEEDDTDDEEEESDEDGEEVDLVETVEGTKNLADLKELVGDNDEFKKLRKGLKKFKGLSGPRDLKAAMLKALGVKPVKKEKKKSTKGSGKGSPIVAKDADKTRYGACGLALKSLKGKTVTSKEIAEKADEIYGEASGADENVKQSIRVWSRYVPFCIVMGLIKKITKGDDKGNFKVK